MTKPFIWRLLCIEKYIVYTSVDKSKWFTIMYKKANIWAAKLCKIKHKQCALYRSVKNRKMSRVEEYASILSRLCGAGCGE